MSWEWEIGISTGIAYDRPILEVIDPLARAGFRVVEVSTAPHHLDICDPAAVAAAARALRDAGLRVVSLHAPFGSDINFAGPEESMRRHALDIMVRAAEALAVLEGPLFVVHPGGEDQRWTWDRDRRLAYAAEGLQRLWEACRARHQQLVVESPLPHLLGGSLDDFDRLLRQLPEEGTGVCADTSHLSLGGQLDPFCERFAGRLVHLQASDNHGVTDDHLPPGEGALDWSAIVATLERSGYRGTFLLEVSCGGEMRDRVLRAAAAVSRLPGAPPVS